MKQFVFFCFCLSFSILLFGQTYPKMPINETTKKITYQDVIEITGMKKDAIYLLISDWASTNFVSSKSAIDYQDKESGVISGKGNFPAGVNTIQSHFKIEIKDEKLRYTFTDFVSLSSTPGVTNFPIEPWYPPKGLMKGMQIKALNDIDTKMKEIIASIEAKIKEGKVDTKW